MIISSRSIFPLIIFSCGIIAANNSDSFVVAKKKSEPKVTAEDCCHEILVAHKTAARIDQYSGQIKGIELTWAEDFFDDEKNALLKKATQEELKECYRIMEKRNKLLESYEQGLRAIRDELKELEQKIMAPKKK